VSDSAGTATAMLSGVKTKGGVLGVAEGITVGDCASATGQHVTSALELAETIGMATGVVSTAAITHATPAAAYAHTPSRGWQVDAWMPPEATSAGCVDIARQLLELPYGDGIEVALGGGRAAFLPESVADPEVPSKNGVRKDGRDLTAEWTSRRDGAAYVWNLEGFEAVDPKTTGPLLGLFQRSHLQFEHDREKDTAGEPALGEMTEKALEILSRDPEGYFLLVEGGRIDHAHHGGNAYRALSDTVEFARAVQVAMDRTDPEDTLIIVTADHSHVLTFAGYPARGNPILGNVRSVEDDGEPSPDLAQAGDGLPYTTLGYGNGPGFRTPKQRRKARDDNTEDPDYLQWAAVPMRGETHGGTDVPVYARGPGAQLIRGVVEQHYLFHVMDEAARLSARAAVGGRPMRGEEAE
jgi:alkaline phosphatase